MANNFPAIRPSLLLDFANAKQLDPRVTFSRASAAKYYDGKTTVKAEENLMPNSRGGSIIGVFGVTHVENVVTAPDGTMTANTLTEDTSSNTHSVEYAGHGAGTYTLSVHVKHGGRYVVLAALSGHLGAGSFVAAIFDVNAGTVLGSVAQDGHTFISASIIPSGNGYYRCVLTCTMVSYFNLMLSLSDITTVPTSGYGRNSYTGDGSSHADVCWFQIENRSFVTAYTPTTTQPITRYIPKLMTALADVPRFQHVPVTGESLGLLVEAAATNLLLYSEDFANAAWTKNNATVSANQIIAPDGTLTGDKLVENTAAGLHSATVLGIALTGVNSWSFFAKAAERSRITLDAYDGATNSLHTFDLSSGTIIADPTSTAKIESVGNGWYRCSVARSAAASAQFGLYLTTTGTTISYTGDGTSGIYIWGAQLEAGSAATSYIKTEGSTVTRASDFARMEQMSWYNAGESTLLCEFAPNRVDSTTNRRVISIGESTDTNALELISTTSGDLLAYAFADGAAQSFLNMGAITVGGLTKIAASYKANDFAASNGGGAVLTDTAGVMPRNIVRMGIGISGTYGDASVFTGTIKSLAYYPKRLTNAELQALTA